ncbi:unnamed protein product [Coregonus sp. 'balchen']|nr:unnamed protein product [Coregonus sp. 'balchen']
MTGGKMKVVGHLSRAAEAKRRVAEGQDMLYSMTQMEACTQDVQQRYRSILGPLSLFFQSSPEGEKRADRVQEERPVSPSVSEGVKTNPTSLADMCQQLQHRIQEHSVLHSTPVEDQQALAVVMTSELGLIWQDLKGLMDEPTLNQEENRQLQAETCQEVLRICQELYLNYLHLLDRLRRRAVFSDQANRSRLGAQMAIDCTSLLNVHSIRRSVAAGIKATRRARLSAERPRAAGRDLKGTPAALPRKLDFSLTLQAKAGCKKSGCSSMPDLQRESLLEELEMEALPSRPQSPLKQEEEEEEEKRERCRVPLEEPEHPQGAVVNVALSHGSLARTAAARISDRVLRDTINIHTYPPVYNYLTKELELSSVRWLDRNLFAGEEIKEVYKELSKSKSTQYLNFDEDPMIEPALTNIRWSLKKKNHQRFINPQLKRQNTNAMSHRKRTEIPEDQKKPEDQNSRAYTAWLQWWKTDLSVEDYLRYITDQDSDYLWAAFHLYDSGDSDDEEDERRRLLQLRRDERKKRRRQKMEALKGQKQEYEEESPDEEITSPKQKVYRRTVTVGSRLERIWTLLCLPDAHRLDMAIKYSSHAHRDQLEKATGAPL